MRSSRLDLSIARSKFSNWARAVAVRGFSFPECTSAIHPAARPRCRASPSPFCLRQLPGFQVLQVTLATRMSECAPALVWNWREQGGHGKLPPCPCRENKDADRRSPYAKVGAHRQPLKPQIAAWSCKGSPAPDLLACKKRKRVPVQTDGQEPPWL